MLKVKCTECGGYVFEQGNSIKKQYKELKDKIEESENKLKKLQRGCSHPHSNRIGAGRLFICGDCGYRVIS